MKFTTDPALINRIKERAIEQVKLRALGVVDALLGDNREFWSDENVTGGDLVTYYNDLTSRMVPLMQQIPLEDGTVVEQPVIAAGVPVMVEERVLDQLRVVSPKLAEDLDKAYNREIVKLTGA